jgi:hypothetical protein
MPFFFDEPTLAKSEQIPKPQSQVGVNLSKSTTTSIFEAHAPREGVSASDIGFEELLLDDDSGHLQ